MKFSSAKLFVTNCCNLLTALIFHFSKVMFLFIMFFECSSRKSGYGHGGSPKLLVVYASCRKLKSRQKKENGFWTCCPKNLDCLQSLVFFLFFIEISYLFIMNYYYYCFVILYSYYLKFVKQYLETFVNIFEISK